MSYKNTKDSFGGLLSEVSSIDSSLFEKKSLKEAQKSQTETKAAQGISKNGALTPSMQTPTSASHMNPQNRTTPTGSGPGMSMQKSASKAANFVSAGSLKTRASDQFDALIGDFSNSRHNRPMRPPVKVSGVANSTIVGIQSTSNGGANHAGSGHNTLDDLFSTSQTQAPLPVDSGLGSSSQILEGFGRPHAPHVPAAETDPFDIFQSPPKEPNPVQIEPEDLLGGFEGSLGVEDHKAPAHPVNLTEPAAVMPEQDGPEENLDIFAPTPVPSKEAPQSTVKQSGLSQASTERATYSADRQRPGLHNTKIEDEQFCGVQNSQQPESTGEAHERVPASHSHGEASSARRDRPTSARRREPASSQLSPGKGSPETASRWQSKDEGSSSWQAAGPGGKDSAKEWLDKGQKWLFTAGKKVAAAAKEASSTIQSKLDEMEVFKSQSKGPRTWSPDDDDMIPEYYKEWAATIERLGPEEQARTLGQMTEDDRLVVQRIMDQSSVRRSSAKRVSPTSRPQQIAESENGARRQAPPRPPQRTHSAEALSQPSPPSRAASGSIERPRRSASYNLGTAPSADENCARPSGSAPVTPERPTPAGTPPKPPVHSHPSSQKARPPPVAQKQQADLLGLFGDEAQSEDDCLGVPSPQPAASSRADSAADLFDMDDESSSRAPQSSAAQGGEDVDILGMFASAPPAASAETGRPHERRAAAPAAVSKPAARGLDELFGAHKPGASMIDFGDEEVSEASATSAVKFTGAGDVDVEGEPEVRRQARARRLAEKQAQIQAALAEKLARDSAEASEKERKVELREEYKERMKAWQQGKDANIRALLSSLDTVLWENSGWKKPAMTDLLEPQRVKRAYMKANLVVHPDKVKQKGGTVEQIVIADIAFDALKGAWAKFEAAELR